MYPLIDFELIQVSLAGSRFLKLLLQWDIVTGIFIPLLFYGWHDLFFILLILDLANQVINLIIQ